MSATRSVACMWACGPRTCLARLEARIDAQAIAPPVTRLRRVRARDSRRTPELGWVRADLSIANAERWAAGKPVPAHAIDDQTAIKVTDDKVEVVSEGNWRMFSPH
jgi:hypothetical protein